jgi:hypothetical protein
MAEVDLYAPIKSFLEGQGYTVKGEIAHCDVVAVRGEETPVVVEIKERLSLALILQAVDRLVVTQTVYIAFRIGKDRSASWRSNRRQVTSMLRRLGIGLLTVSARDRVEAVIDPAPYAPRNNRRRQQRLLREFSERIGDPEAGGSVSRPRMTAYRQAAIACAQVLAEVEVQKVSVLRDQTGVERAGTILRDNHYGWFLRVKTGHYQLTPKGREELNFWQAPRTS